MDEKKTTDEKKDDLTEGRPLGETTGEDGLTESQRLEAYVKNPAEGAKHVEAQKKFNESKRPKLSAAEAKAEAKEAKAEAKADAAAAKAEK